MRAFEYKAVDNNGKKIHGVIQAESPRDARLQVRGQGLLVLSLDETGNAAPRGMWVLRVSRKDLAVLTRHLATLLLSGMPLDMALQAAARQSEKQRVAAVLLKVRSIVMEGKPLAVALAAYPRFFDDLYRAMVRAGEESGQLGLVLSHLADYVENRLYTQQRLAMAMLYPVILLLVASGIVLLLMTYVIPKIVRIFEYSHTNLPILTKMLIATSQFLAQGGGLFLLAGIIILAWVIRRWLSAETHLLQWHRFYLRVPILGTLVKTIESARFTAALGILASSGVPLALAMRISSGVIRNRAMRQASSLATERLESGGSLSRALQLSGVFPAMTVHMIANGELSGELAVMLNKVAAYQERELEFSSQSFLAIFEPVMILVMGGIVLLIVMAILIPIFDMNALVK